MIGDRILRTVQTFYPNVTKVVDGRKSLEIEVTEDDAHLSERKNHKQCALARACHQAAQVDGVIVSRAIVLLVKGTLAYRYELSASLKTQIKRFDKGLGFEPGAYILTAPAPSHRLGERHRQILTGNPSSRAYKPRNLDLNVRAALSSGRRMIA